VSETDNEIKVAADLPGMDEKNVEVLVADDLLTIRGEKKAEHEEKERDYRLMERASGTFSRFIRLPFSVEPSQIQATFKNGVLTVTIPKPKEAQDKVHRIEVKASNGGDGHDTSASAEPSSAGSAQSSAQS
jgi:HSP20 family protein